MKGLDLRIGPGWVLLVPVLLLSGLGLVALSSMDGELAKQQAVFLAVSLIGFLVVSRIDYRVLGRFRWLMYGGLLTLIFSVSLWGEKTGGAVRWLNFWGVTVQPSVLSIPWLVVVLASQLVESEKGGWRLWGMVVAMFGASFWLVFRQPDLGTALVLAAGFLAMVLSRGIRRRQLIWGLILVVGLLGASPLILKDYQKQRLASFVRPANDPLGAGYHVIQSTIAVGSGRFWGRGWGQGTQSNLRFLPAAETDFIFAAIAEEFGLIGAALLLFLYGVLFWLMARVVSRTKDRLGRVLATGIWGLMFFQTMVNVGMNLGLAPVTGITLPGVSYGGSSLVSVFVSLGLMSSVAGQVGRLEEEMRLR